MFVVTLEAHEKLYINSMMFDFRSNEKTSVAVNAKDWQCVMRERIVQEYAQELNLDYSDWSKCWFTFTMYHLKKRNLTQLATIVAKELSY